MHSQRLSFIQMLEYAFEKEPELKIKCQKSSELAIQRNDLGRIFNDFPLFLPGSEFYRLSKQFIEILTQVKKIKKDEQGFHLMDKQNKIAVCKWILELIKIGCRNLLNSKGQLKSSLLNILGWEKYLKKCTKKQIHYIVFSFISTAYEQLISASNERIAEHLTAYHATLQFFNESLEHEIDNALGQFWKSKNPSKKMYYMYMGMGLSAAALSGFLFFAANKSSSLESTSNLEIKPSQNN